MKLWLSGKGFWEVERVNKDLTRTVGPLRKADDAVSIDSTHLTIDEVIEEMMKHINNDS